MKKELKQATITCRFNNLLDPAHMTKAVNLVTFKVRSEELAKLMNDSDYKSYLEILADSYPTVSDGSYTDEQKKAVCTTDYDLFIAHEKLIADLKEQVEKIPVTLADFNALAPTDKAMVLIECHKNMKSISVEITGDFSKAVNAFFNSGKLADVKNLFRAGFNSAVGEPGELFAGYKIKKSDFSDADIRKAVSLACAGAKRKSKKITDPKTGEKVEVLQKYEWDIRTDSKTVNRIASELFGVVIESRADTLEQVKPAEKKPAEKKPANEKK